MADSKVPYVNAYGTITKTLDALRKASTPDRFTQDFLATKLAVKGGSAKPVIPFLKRIGFLASDGAPTDLYKKFRNEALAGAAAAEALKIGFGPLYEINEYVHDLKDNELRGVVVQATGMEASSTSVKSIIGSFKALRAYADFDAPPVGGLDATDGGDGPGDDASDGQGVPTRINLGYTINLHLPATSDVAVFNAIFKSLREHLLR
jgi:Family of unknown function (DUF5343)